MEETSKICIVGRIYKRIEKSQLGKTSETRVKFVLLEEHIRELKNL